MMMLWFFLSLIASLSHYNSDHKCHFFLEVMFLIPRYILFFSKYGKPWPLSPPGIKTTIPDGPFWHKPLVVFWKLNIAHLKIWICLQNFQFSSVLKTGAADGQNQLCHQRWELHMWCRHVPWVLTIHFVGLYQTEAIPCRYGRPEY